MSGCGISLQLENPWLDLRGARSRGNRGNELLFGTVATKALHLEGTDTSHPGPSDQGLLEGPWTLNRGPWHFIGTT